MNKDKETVQEFLKPIPNPFLEIVEEIMKHEM
jgi:hypothetical protein